jgi:ABC-2 type transport system permease protein
MKNIWIITKTYMRRNLFTILLSVAVGGMLCFMLSVMGNIVVDTTLSNIKVGVLDYDKSSLSGDFKNYLTEKLKYDIIEDYTYDQLSKVLIDKDISAIIEIPEGYEEQVSRGVKQEIAVTALDDYENAAFLQANINNYLSGIHILSVSAGGDPEVFGRLISEYQNENIEITQTSAVEIDKKAIAQEGGFINSVGFFLMFVFSISIFLSFQALDDRIYGVFDRIQITPVKPAQYILGAGTLGLLTSFLEVGIYCTYIKIMKISIGVPFWLAVLFMSLFSVFTVCFSLMTALAVRSKNTITSIVIGFSTIGCILGGAYFPISMSPESLQNLARLLPQFWFMDGLRKLQEDITANVLPDITILALFTVLTFLVGAVLYSQNTKSN